MTQVVYSSISILFFLVTNGYSALDNLALNAIDNYLNDNITELLEWSAPFEMQRSLVYYQASWDKENHPIFVQEAGIWDMKRWSEGSKEESKNFSKYFDQLIARFAQAISIGKPEDGSFIVIVDMEKYNINQFASVATIQKIMEVLLKHNSFVQRHMKLAYIINANYAFDMLWRVIRPAVSSYAERVQIYAGKKWKSELVKQLGRDNLPEFYGGYKNFTPLAVYG